MIKNKIHIRQEDVFTTIMKILIDYGVPKRKISLQTSFKNMGLISLDMMGLMMEIEYYLQVYIPNSDMDKLTNMKTTTNYILKLAQNKT